MLIAMMVDRTIPAGAASMPPPWAARARRRSRRHDPCLEFFFDTISRMPLLTASEEVELGYRAMVGNRNAQHTLISRNLRLVVMFARRFQGRGLSLNDLIGLGCIGLIRGAEKFDPGRGVRCSTYFSWWIKQAIYRGLCDTSRTIRLPVHIVEGMAQWQRAVNRLRDEGMGSEPSPTDVAQSLGWTGRLQPRAAAVCSAIRSLVYDGQDKPVTVEEGPGDWDVVADEPEPVDLLADAELAERRKGLVADVLDQLPEREADVLRMRFGLGSQPPMTLRQVGEQYGCCRETVLNWERAGLAKAREVLGDVGEAV